MLRTHEWAPRVLIANSNLVGDWANWPEFRRLEQAGLTMYGQMTAGSWIYIGTQGILQGTYETFAAVAAKRFGGTLAGTLTVTGGCGGMGGAQPLAVTLNDGVALVIDVDPARLARRGDRVAVLARRYDMLVDAANEAGPGALAVACDVTDEESCRTAVDRAADELGGIDALDLVGKIGFGAFAGDDHGFGTGVGSNGLSLGGGKAGKCEGGNARAKARFDHGIPLTDD